MFRNFLQFHPSYSIILLRLNQFLASTFFIKEVNSAIWNSWGAQQMLLIYPFIFGLKLDLTGADFLFNLCDCVKKWGRGYHFQTPSSLFLGYSAKLWSLKTFKIIWGGVYFVFLSGWPVSGSFGSVNLKFESINLWTQLMLAHNLKFVIKRTKWQRLHLNSQCFN